LALILIYFDFSVQIGWHMVRPAAGLVISLDSLCDFGVQL
jgi:hypothetical protein